MTEEGRKLGGGGPARDGGGAGTIGVNQSTITVKELPKEEKILVLQRKIY